MKSKVIYLIVFTLLQWGCRKMEPATSDLLPIHRYIDNVIVTQTNYVSKAGKYLYFDLEAVSCKNGSTHTLLPDVAFQPYMNANAGITIEVESIVRSSEQANKALDVVLLIDLSQPDFMDWMGPAFLNEVSRLVRIAQDNADVNLGVGLFARNMEGSEQVVFCRNPETGSIFDNNEQFILNFLAQNIKEIGQYDRSSMLDAISFSVDELLTLQTNHQRNIVLLNGNDDDATGMVSSAMVLQKCKDNDVTVNYINWGDNYCSYVELAMETGGFYTATNSIGTFSTSVFSIHELLAKNYERYTLRCKATYTANWQAGYYLCGIIPVEYLEEIDSPYFEEDLYNDLEVSGFLPVYINVK